MHRANHTHMCVWLVHRGTFVSTYCMLICVYVFGIIGHWLTLLSLHRLWRWAFKEVNKCRLQPTKWNLYWAHPWFTIPALLQRKKKKDGGEDRGRSEGCSSNPTVWRKDVFVPPLTAVGRHFRTPPATITLVKPKPLHSISVCEVGCVCVSCSHKPRPWTIRNTPWGLRAEVRSRPEYYFWRNICYVSVSKGKRMRGWERSKTIGCERSERKKLFCFH